MVRVKIVGAGGYGGVGIVELLLRHPQARIISLVDVADVGKPLSEVYPHLAGFFDKRIVAPTDPEAGEPVDVVFLATPDGVGMKLAQEELKGGAKVIDYSGDFRFNSTASYAEYAVRIGRDPIHASPELLDKTVYGLAEIHRNEIGADRRIVGNPGCFAVSCILGLAPAMKRGMVEADSVICDCATGVSGAGKKVAPTFHFPARHECMNAYKLAGHQHVCEIERELGLLAQAKVTIIFTAHVVPVCRGIMSTLYGRLKKGIGEKDVMAAYSDYYKNETFVRIYGRDAAVTSMHVRGTNYCNLVVDYDARTHRIRVVSYIDNLMKGQASNALQNMNLLFGLAETTGLDRPGQYP